MAEPLKNVYNQQFMDDFTSAVIQVVPGMDKASFIKAVFDEAWQEMELKQRMRHLAMTLHKFLTDNYPENASLLISIVKQLQNNGLKENSFEYMFLPDYIEVYGLEHYDDSIRAIEYITQFTSCEFAVRPFIIRYQDKMVNQLQKWARHQHLMVRRLASEGARPRLPWAIAIPAFKKNPAFVIPILEHLKNDEAETVRRSVANNLNDIAKDNPEVVIKMANQWKGENKNTDWVVKHGCRTLLKQGNPEVLQLFGFSRLDDIKIMDFTIETPGVTIGNDLTFSFDLLNQHADARLIRLEYGIYYMKSNGTLSRKVFKISEKEYDGMSRTPIIRNQPFKVITTRVLYPGAHQVSIIVNGQELVKADFEVRE